MTDQEYFVQEYDEMARRLRAEWEAWASFNHEAAEAQRPLAEACYALIGEGTLAVNGTVLGHLALAPNLTHAEAGRLHRGYAEFKAERWPGRCLADYDPHEDASSHLAYSMRMVLKDRSRVWAVAVPEPYAGTFCLPEGFEFFHERRKKAA